MKKVATFLLVFVIFFSFLFFHKSLVKAQDTSSTIEKTGYNRVCLNASLPNEADKGMSMDWCGGCPHMDAYDRIDRSQFDDTVCEMWPQGPVHQCFDSHIPDTGQATFRLDLKTDCPEGVNCQIPDGIPFYIAVCIAAEGDQNVSYRCTTSDPEIDAKYGLNNEGVYAALSYGNKEDKTFYASDLPIQGVIANIGGYTSYSFFAIYDAQLMGAGGTDTAAITGQAASEQLGTTQFSKPIFEQDSTKQTCATLFWDPYGRVFDSQSLEPMSNIQVRMLSSLNPEKLATVPTKNPNLTDDGGVFNFLTTPGSYYIRLANIPSTHTFTSTPKLNSKYNLIYRQSRSGIMSLYKPDEVIKELIDTPEEKRIGRPFAEERDIALDPGTNTPYTTPIKSLSIEQGIENGYVIIKGRASHAYPLVTIKDTNGNILLDKKEFTNDQARYGFWQLSMKASQFPTTVGLIPVLAKNPKYFKTDTSVKINQTAVILDPILRNIQGYAKDAQGKILPNTLVTVILKAKNTVFYQTRTDSSGFFSIDSTHLPPDPYYLKYGSLVVSTYQFGQDNKSYLTTNKVNLMNIKINNPTTKNNPLVTPASALPNKLNPSFYGTDKSISSLAKSLNSNLAKKEILIIILIIFVLVVVVAMLVIYIVRHRDQVVQ